MKLKITILILSAMLAAPAAGFCAALSMEEAACAALAPAAIFSLAWAM